MNKNKQSSVQWFLDKLIEHRIIIVDQTTYGDKVKPKHEILLEQAKAMHKEEIIAAKDDNYVYGEAWEKLGTLGEQYYNETYGGNNEQQ